MPRPVPDGAPDGEAAASDALPPKEPVAAALREAAPDAEPLAGAVGEGAPDAPAAAVPEAPPLQLCEGGGEGAPLAEAGAEEGVPAADAEAVPLRQGGSGTVGAAAQVKGAAVKPPAGLHT